MIEINVITNIVGQNRVKMELETTVENIRKLYITVSGKADADVMILYRGYANGITNPWIIRVDAREHASKGVMEAANELFKTLKKELAEKIASNDRHTNELRKTMIALGN